MHQAPKLVDVFEIAIGDLDVEYVYRRPDLAHGLNQGLGHSRIIRGLLHQQDAFARFDVVAGGFGAIERRAADDRSAGFEERRRDRHSPGAGPTFDNGISLFWHRPFLWWDRDF